MVGNFTNFTKLEFLEHLDLVALGAKSTFLADLEFAKLGRLAEKNGSRAVF